MIIDTKKVVSAFVGLVTGVAMSGAAAVMPLVAKADTTSDLQAQIAQMLAQIQVLQAQLSAAGGTTVTGTGYQFTTLMKQGVTGAEVKELQKVLNMDPATQVSTSGAGAPGMESMYFGSKTKAAVMKFQAKYALGADGVVGAKTRAKLNSMGGGTGTGPVVTGTDLVVALASDTPAAGSLIAGQAVADLAHFTLTNKSAVDAKVTNIKFSRTGISNDSTLVNVYLYEGAKRLTDSAAVSQTKITFNDTGLGIITIPAGMSKTIAVKADILANTAGQVVGVALDSVTSNVTVTTALPIGGHMMSIASATMAGVNFGAVTTPSTATINIDPQDGYIMWQNTVNVTTRAVDLKSVNLRQIGSIGTSDLRNFKLYVDGMQVGTTVASMDGNGYVTFDLTSSPLRLQTGSRIIKLVGDIVGGSTRTFSFSLRQPGDAVFVDSELGQPVLAQYNGGTFQALTTGTHTVNPGNLTITKKADSRSGNVASNSNNVDLAKFEFKAAGEPIKVENLRVYANVSTGGLTYLRNGALFANGVQVGSTLNLADFGASPAYTEFNLGSSLIVTPGTPVVVEVRADIYGTTTLANGDSIQVGIAAGVNNLQRTNSLNYISNNAVTANSISVATGAIALSKNAAYGSQTTVDGKTAYKVGSFNLVSGSAENVNLDAITVNFSGSTSTIATQLSDVYVVYGTKTTNVKSSIVAGDNSFSVNEVLAANGTLAVDVYATLATTFESADQIVASSTVTGTTAISGTAVQTGYIVGQTITIQNGTIVAAFLNESALATKLLVGGTEQKVATYKFTATNDSFTVTDIATKVTTQTEKNAGAITGVVLKLSGSTSALNGFGTPLNGYIASSTGLTINVPANSETKVDVYLTLNSVGAGAASTTANVGVTLEGFKYQASAGDQGENATDAAANSMYVVKTVPTISNVTLPDTILSAGTKTISKFSVTPDAAGPISWKKIVFTYATSTNVTIGSYSMVDAGNNVIAGAYVVSGGTIAFTATDEQLVSSTQTYSLKATVGGTIAANNYVSVNMVAAGSALTEANDYDTIAAGASAFVWSDRSSLSHGTSTPDWLNDFKVKNLTTDTQTITAP